MKLIIIILYFIPFLVNGQNGAIAGNAFWKYNDYVGNKPDAGSKIYIIPFDSTQERIETYCDVQGNFKVENLKSGSYLVCVLSKNTNTDGSRNFIELDDTLIKKYFGFDFKQVDPIKYDSIEVLHKRWTKLLLEDTQGMKQKELRKHIQESSTLRGIYYKAMAEYLRNISSSKIPFDFYLDHPLQQRIYIEEVSVSPNKTSKPIIKDFGTTYL